MFDVLINGVPFAAAAGGEEEGGSFLVEPGIGLMIWTLLVFVVAMFLLSKLAFPKIAEALDKRQKAIEESIETAERTKAESEQLLAEYRERLKEARTQAEEIVARARRAGEEAQRESQDKARVQREELMEQTRRDIEAETRRAIQEIRREVADLTVAATEKVTRKTLTGDDQRRLVEEALARARLLRPLQAGTRTPMEEIAQVYARSLFEVAKLAGDAATPCATSSPRSADALEEHRELSVFFFSPYFSTEEKKDGLDRAIDGADPIVRNFLELLVEKHRMPAIFRIRRELRPALGGGEQAPPGPDHQRDRARRADRALDRRPDRRADRPARRAHDDRRRGRSGRPGAARRQPILDASIRNRLDNLRRSVAKAS